MLLWDNSRLSYWHQFLREFGEPYASDSDVVKHHMIGPTPFSAELLTVPLHRMDLTGQWEDAGFTWEQYLDAWGGAM